ncbi:MAG: hypothetical protein KDB71_10170 [Mycobacterium sp.]|nr:hypothetical protein [Mycobacterium sp.]
MAARFRRAATALMACAVAGAAPAAADPPGQPDQAAAEPAPAQGPIETLTAIGNVLGQRDAGPAGPLGLPDMSANTATLLLGQNAIPTAPGSTAPAVVPNLSAFNAEYLLGQNLSPAAPGQGNAAPGIGPDQDNPGTGRIAFLRRLNEMYQAGGLKGALLGQLPTDELGQPTLPVTTPSAD